MYLMLALALVLAFASYATADGSSVTYESDGRSFEGYYISPSPDAPLVLLVHDWDGLTDYEVTRSDMLAELGYAVFAVDLFGAGVRPESMDEMRRLTTGLNQDREQMRTLMNAGLEAARAQGANADRAVALGYCFGGGAVLEFARAGVDLRGFVTFHGVLRTPEGRDYSKARGTYLVFHGSADQSVTMEDFANLAIELEEAGLPHEMITYGGAPHAFTVFGTERYREDADKKSWERLKGWLKEVLG
jgi:dienelactone hydrolase